MIRNPFEKRSTPPDIAPDPVQTEQQLEVVLAKEVNGFPGLEVAYTLEQKRSEKRNASKRNEDAAFVDPAIDLFGVFDGVGSEANAADASATAARELPDVFLEEQTRHALRTIEEVQDDLEDLLTKQTERRNERRPFSAEGQAEMQANVHEEERMLDLLEEDGDLAVRTLALLTALTETNTPVQRLRSRTTACAGFIHRTTDGKRYAVVANIGDSGALIVPPSGPAEQITQDDSLMEQLLASRALTSEKLLAMKRDPARQYPLPIPIDALRVRMNNISYYELIAYVMQTLGDGGKPSLSIRELHPGDTLVVATDGLIDRFETWPTQDTTVQTVLKERMDFTGLAAPLQSPAPLTEQLDELRYETALRRSYKRTDDIAIIAARVKKE
jgi:serine/threonine protein phosphatase PrpC